MLRTTYNRLRDDFWWSSCIPEVGKLSAAGFQSLAWFWRTARIAPWFLRGDLSPILASLCFPSSLETDKGGFLRVKLYRLAVEKRFEWSFVQLKGLFWPFWRAPLDCCRKHFETRFRGCRIAAFDQPGKGWKGWTNRWKYLHGLLAPALHGFKEVVDDFHRDVFFWRTIIVWK